MGNEIKAFITGITGQDGAHLSEILLSKGVRVFGSFRRGSHHKTWRLDELNITQKITLIEAQSNDPIHLIKMLDEIKPNMIFHLSGISFISDSFRYPASALEQNTIGTINLLEASKISCPEAKLFFASSSEIFGSVDNGKLLSQDSEKTPKNPYGVSKLAANQMVKIYRDCFDIQCCSGILFNHEGPFRSRQFVTRKISFNLARLRLLGGAPLELGNFDSSRDWGSAQDYTLGMLKLLELDNLEDVIFASGKLSTVRTFLTLAANECGFNPIFEGDGIKEICVDKNSGKLLARVSEKYFRKFDTCGIAGDSSRLKQITGWTNKKNIENIAREMVQADLERIKKGRVDV